MLLDGIAEKKLDNGLKIVALEKKGAPVISVQIWYKTGSASETDGSRGISHFLEHMMFRGSAGVSSEEHMRRITDVGGHANAFTAEDATVYIDNIPSDALDMALSLEADRMDGLLFEPKLFETERRVIIEEYHSHMNNPVAKALLEFRAMFYGNHPYALSPLGRLEDIASFSSDVCKDYYRRFYVPTNAVLVVVGDAEPGKIFDTAALHFGGKNSHAVPQPCTHPTAPMESRCKGRHLARKIEFDVPLIVAGYPAPSASHDDAAALEILQLVAAGGETSRLHREVVRRRSLAIMTGGMNHLLRDAGMSMFFAAFTPGTGAGRVEAALAAELRRIRDDGITQEELERAKNITLTNRIFELYSAENICYRIGYGETVEGDFRQWVKHLDLLRGLGRDRLTETARRWWDDVNRCVLVLEPRRPNPLLYLGGLVRRIAGRTGDRRAKGDVQ